jgi:hypothetical protein
MIPFSRLVNETGLREVVVRTQQGVKFAAAYMLLKAAILAAGIKIEYYVGPALLVVTMRKSHIIMIGEVICFPGLQEKAHYARSAITVPHQNLIGTQIDYVVIDINMYILVCCGCTSW